MRRAFGRIESRNSWLTEMPSFDAASRARSRSAGGNRSAVMAIGRFVKIFVFIVRFSPLSSIAFIIPAWYNECEFLLLHSSSKKTYFRCTNAMKRKLDKKPTHYLHHLVMFLNDDLKAPLTNLFGDRADSLEKVKALQVELRGDVARLMNPPPRPSDAHSYADASSPAEYWLGTVVDKINGIHFIPGRFVSRWPDPLLKGYRHNVLRLGREQLVVLNVPIMDGTRDYCYWYFDEVLKSGEFSTLRRCPSCLKYFVTQRSNKQCCDRDCTTAYQNKRRLRSGYFNDYRALKRKRSRRK